MRRLPRGFRRCDGRRLAARFVDCPALAGQSPEYCEPDCEADGERTDRRRGDTRQQRASAVFAFGRVDATRRVAEALSVGVVDLAVARVISAWSDPVAASRLAAPR